MCATSAILDYGYRNPPWYDHWQPLPAPINPFPLPQQPQPIILPDLEAREAIKKFLEMLEAAKAFDKATKQPECEDPKKAEFEKKVLDRLDAIEKRLAAV